MQTNKNLKLVRTNTNIVKYRRHIYLFLSMYLFLLTEIMLDLLVWPQSTYEERETNKNFKMKNSCPHGFKLSVYESIGLLILLAMRYFE